MATIFKTGWNSEKGKYASKYGAYQAYLDCFNESSILKALYDAIGHYSNAWVTDLLAAASDPYKKEEVTIEQGTHQVENTVGGGFCLHFTGRFRGKAFHFYVVQDSNANLKIFEISYFDGSLKSYYWS